MDAVPPMQEGNDGGVAAPSVFPEEPLSPGEALDDTFVADAVAARQLHPLSASLPSTALSSRFAGSSTIDLGLSSSYDNQLQHARLQGFSDDAVAGAELPSAVSDMAPPPPIQPPPPPPPQQE